MSDDDTDALLSIDLRTLMMVLAIDQTGSITGAARQLGYSQPAISQHLRRMEARLGVPLVQKIGRSSRLTDAGRVVLRVAPSINQGLRFAGAQIRDIRSLNLGRLRVAASTAVTRGVAVPALTRMRAQHPDLVISYTETEPLRAIELVHAGKADAAVVFRNPRSSFTAPWLRSDDTEMRDILRDSLHVVVPSTHPLADRGRVPLEMLADEQWIGPAGGEGESLRELAAEAGFSPETSIQTNNVTSSIRFVAQGFGACLTSRIELAGISLPATVRALDVEPAELRTLTMVIGRHQQESPVILAFLRILRGMRDRSEARPLPG